MAEQHLLHFNLEQHPLFDLDVHDAAATRDWRKRSIEQEVMLTGQLPLRMVHVGVGVQRIGKLELRLEPKIELEHAAVFLMVSRQPDIVRSYREGEITVEEADGKYRAVVTLEYAHPTGRWWTARRRVGTNQVSVGVFHGDWVETEGEGLEALEERLREWVDTTGVELGDSHQELTPNDTMPEILCGVSTLNAQPPLQAQVFADIVGNMVDKQLVNQYRSGSRCSRSRAGRSSTSSCAAPSRSRSTTWCARSRLAVRRSGGVAVPRRGGGRRGSNRAVCCAATPST